MKHYGDITKINGADVEIVDIVTGGSPCQDLSVAGKRAGLAGERSGLFMEQIRIIKEMRAADECRNRRSNVNIRPRFMVWENVPGAFSSNKGEDFRAVLEETAKVADEATVIPRPTDGKWAQAGCIMGDGWSIAWRVHDAQFWGVPQRRKRIALVADFNGQSAPEILFERKSVSGNITESREEGQGITETSERNANKAEWGGTYDIRISSDGTKNWRAHCYETNISRALDTGGENPDSNHGGVAIVYGICSDNSNSMKSGNPNSGIYEADTSRTLDLNGGSPACNQGGMAIVESINGEIAGTLDTSYYKGCGERQGVERTIVAVSQDAYDKYTENSVSATIKESGGIYGGAAKPL